MYHHLTGTEVTSGTPDDDATLHWLADRYAYPPAHGDRPWLRVNMVASIDGAATHGDLTADLGGPGDRALFRVLRALADVVIAGARTAVAEGYRVPKPDDVFTSARARAGQRAAPPLVLVSRTLSIPTDYPPLTDAATVVVTCRAADRARRDALAQTGVAVVDCGDDRVDPSALLAWCGSRGWRRLLSEGGPTLLGSFIDADVVDELCVTTTPTLVAGEAPRIAHHRATPTLHPMVPTAVLGDDDGFLYTRWTRPGSATADA